MKKILYFVSLLLLAGIIVVACKKDDDSQLIENSIPKINGLSSTTGAAGSKVTISGENFGATPNANSVLFGTQEAEVVSALESSLTAKVPAIPEGEPTTFKIKVTTDGKLATSSQDFEVTTQITLNTDNLMFSTLDLSSQTLVATTNAIDYSITWESSNTDVVTVNGSGEVTPIAVGDAQITASVAGVYEQVNVTVVEGTVPTITLNKSILTLYPFAHYQQTLLAETTDAEGETIVWTSSDETIATVEQDGTVMPLTEGEVTITASVAGVSDQCAVTIVNGPVTELALNQSELELYTYDTAQLSISALVADVEETGNPVWSSEDETIVAVDQEGNIEALSAGSTTVKVTVDNMLAICTINVLPNVVIGGSTFNQNNKRVATVWINEKAVELTDGIASGEVNDIFEYNQIIYAVGYHSGAKLWKISLDETYETIDLSIQGNTTIANSIFVYNQDVYVVGEKDDGDTTFPVKWTNGVASDLNYNALATTTEAKSIFVDASGEYIVGSEIENNWRAVIWENGTKSPLSDKNSKANSVYRHNGTTYTGGYIEDDQTFWAVATLWLDDYPFDLIDNMEWSTVSSVFVNESGDYSVGHYGGYIARTWVGNSQFGWNLSENDAIANDIHVHNTSRYVLVEDIDGAKLFKNGSEVFAINDNSVEFNAITVK